LQFLDEKFQFQYLQTIRRKFRDYLQDTTNAANAKELYASFQVNSNHLESREQLKTIKVKASSFGRNVCAQLFCDDEIGESEESGDIHRMIGPIDYFDPVEFKK
jgi:hypothetical protein